MTNITKILNEYLLEHLLYEEIEIIYNDLFPEELGDCLISRHDPSTSNEISYIDGSSVGELSIAYYMRSEDAEKCRSILNAICNAVDNLICTDEDGTEYTFSSQTLPCFVSEDDKHQICYTCEIKCEYSRNGE